MYAANFISPSHPISASNSLNDLWLNQGSLLQKGCNDSADDMRHTTAFYQGNLHLLVSMTDIHPKIEDQSRHTNSSYEVKQEKSC